MLHTIAAALALVVAAPTPAPSSPKTTASAKAAAKAPMKSTTKLSSAPVVAPPPPPPPEPIDPGTVQSIDVVEVLADDCPGLIDRDRRFCGRGRRFELRRGEKERALSLITATGGARACAEQPTHAFFVHTTKGPRVVAVSFRCKTIGGRAFTGTGEQEAASFFRAQGLVNGL